MKLGDQLKEARTRAGLKQEELAQELGVSRQTISNWENNRSFPDIGSMMRLSSIYGMSLDALLKTDESVLAQYEDIAAKRRKFWQMMLEISIILQLVGSFLWNQDFTGIGAVLQLAGIGMMYISLVMHLRVFSHSREELWCGWLALGIQSVLILLALWKPELTENIFFMLVRLAPPIMLLLARVWTIDWKSTRLWLIIFLFVGVPLFNTGKFMQDEGYLNNANPFGEDYRIQEILYPENTPVNENLLIDLYGTYSMYIAEDSLNTELIGYFTYIDPLEGQSEQGIWRLVPEDDPDTLYQLTVETDDRIILSCYQAEQLQWKWLLMENDRDTCFLSVATFGSTISTQPKWYPAGSPDPMPYFKTTDVVGSATVNLTVGGLETETLTLYEEYHYGESVEYQTYTLEPHKPGVFKLKLKTHYETEGVVRTDDQYALYRIPFKGGEYRFCLTFG